MTLAADQILDTVLTHAPDARGYWIAFSGGLDSQVLLHALAARRGRLPAPLGALHVNHNLQPDAPGWAEHCRAVCAALEIPCRTLSVDAQPEPGDSPEAAARAARYGALAGAVPAGGVLLTAHHRDDQAETLLLQLVRGAGPKGLAAMPAVSMLDGKTLLRPLLGFGRDELHDYALRHALAWIEDPSNARLDYDRNYLRHEILPRLRARWPATGATLARAARHQAEAAQLLEELAALDAHAAAGGWPASLSVSALLRLSAPRRANLLRWWLRQRGAAIPGAAVVARIDRDLLRAAPDAEPLVGWAGVRLRRYRDALLLDDLREEADATFCLEWDVHQPLALPGGTLGAEYAHGAGVALRHLADGHCEVRFRRGGERLQPAARREHHSLKHLFQDAGVPPWERARVPLIYRGDTLMAVAGYWVCEGFQAAADEPGVRFLWSRAIVPAGSFW
jgi:tRNA(Ile)-lysidine synthase